MGRYNLVGAGVNDPGGSAVGGGRSGKGGDRGVGGRIGEISREIN